MRLDQGFLGQVGKPVDIAHVHVGCPEGAVDGSMVANSVLENLPVGVLKHG